MSGRSSDGLEGQCDADLKLMATNRRRGGNDSREVRRFDWENAIHGSDRPFEIGYFGIELEVAFTRTRSIVGGRRADRHLDQPLP
jgi:hypothetical protein